MLRSEALAVRRLEDSADEQYDTLGPVYVCDACLGQYRSQR